MVSFLRRREVMPSLTSQRLVLREMNFSDRDQWFQLRSANAVWLKPWDPTNPQGASLPVSFRQMLAAKRAAARVGASYSWVITLPQLAKKNPPIIGQISVSGIQYGAARNASIGYWIDRSHAGFGLMPEACALVIDHCFSTLELHRLEINIRPENTPSLQVVRKLGFRDEGLRAGFLHIDGAWRDHRTFALNREELKNSMLERIYE